MHAYTHISAHTHAHTCTYMYTLTLAGHSGDPEFRLSNTMGAPLLDTVIATDFLIHGPHFISHSYALFFHKVKIEANELTHME